MTSLKLIVVFLASCLMAAPCLALSGVPSLVDSDATIPAGTGQVLTLMVVPDGSGPAFTEAVDLSGNVVDATIEVLLVDALLSPIANYPREDIWLDWDESAEGLAMCTPSRWGGIYPVIHLDDEMDNQGISHFSLPQHSGGYVEGPVYVMINGSRLIGRPGLLLRFNSPDITGDGQVNLSDIVPFAEDFYGGYHFRSDLEHDGVINLSDVAKIAQHMGAGCP